MGDPVMSTPKQRPKFGRAEIREVAAWMESLGWVYDRTDASDHVWYVYPPNGARHSLPQTPSSFSVKLTRRRVLRLMGRESDEGKRNATKLRTKAERSRAAKRKRDADTARKHAAQRARIVAAKDARRAEIRASIKADASRQKTERLMSR
jgi:hypothetical protein